MKPIYLRELLPYIRGKVIWGERNPLIQHVLKAPKYSLLKDHTLFFHSKRVLSLEKTKHFKNLVIITSNPNLLTKPGNNVTVVKVNNMKKAYWSFVEYYRGLLKLPFIAITGTCGKTTTKEMVSWIFSKDYSVYKTIRNENDPSRHLDYLLGVNQHTEIVVMETAVAVPGHLEKAFRYFNPHVGILTSIGIDHLNGFPDLDSYIQEKLSIFSLIDPNGTVVVNADDEHIQKINLKQIDKKIVTVGMKKDADFRIGNIEYSGQNMKFRLFYEKKMYHCFVPGLGKHNVYNATAAIAAASQFGLDMGEIIERLQSFPQIPQHVEVVKGLNGSTLIDDTWSSNPTSIASSLEVLKNISKGKKKIAVLGEIKFLGDRSKEIHTLVGNIVANEKVDYLITIGTHADPISSQAISMGMNSNQVFNCENPQQAYDILSKLADAESIILVKTSMYQSYKKFIEKLRTN